MIVYIMTDMEGVAGIDRWEQCYAPEDDSPAYRFGCAQLTADANAAIEGAFDAGATEVRICDGHGRNRHNGFMSHQLDPRAIRVATTRTHPQRLEGCDASVYAVAVIGQHAMAGTIRGFIDHTQIPRDVCRFFINGEEHGELSLMAMYAGAFNSPVVYASGDEALCAEAHRLFPSIRCTPTKRGTGWGMCELYPPDHVRAQIRAELAAALGDGKARDVWKPAIPATLRIEWSWSGAADVSMRTPGVCRIDARTIEWTISDARDCFGWPIHVEPQA